MNTECSKLNANLCRSLVLGLVLAILNACATPAQTSQDLVNSKSTTVYLVRHAEKYVDQGRDPALTETGKQRAGKWAEILGQEPIAAVFSTDTTRTRDTAKPIAARHGLDVQLYSANDVNHRNFLAANRGRSVVVVGHSNTIPGFVNGLIQNDKYQDLDETQYSNLYIVTEVNGVASASVLIVNLDEPIKGK